MAAPHRATDLSVLGVRPPARSTRTARWLPETPCAARNARIGGLFACYARGPLEQAPSLGTLDGCLPHRTFENRGGRCCPSRPRRGVRIPHAGTPYPTLASSSFAASSSDNMVDGAKLVGGPGATMCSPTPNGVSTAGPTRGEGFSGSRRGARHQTSPKPCGVRSVVHAGPKGAIPGKEARNSFPSDQARSRGAPYHGRPVCPPPTKVASCRPERADSRACSNGARAWFCRCSRSFRC